MSIHNVTATTFDHICTAKAHPDAAPCGAQQTVAHPDKDILIKQTIEGREYLTIRCAVQGHWECLNADLTEADETNPTKNEASREQVRNVRALHKHLGLPVK